MHVRDWRTKAALQRAFSSVPGGHHLNYALQRTIGGLPRSEEQLARDVEVGRDHIRSLHALGIEPAQSLTFEFGAGYDLHMPLIQRALGVQRQLLVDIRRVARASLVRDIAARLHDSLDLSAPASPALDELLHAYGIEYHAPADARATQLDDGSVDVVITTNTLEHIPPEDLESIYRECRRIVRVGGGMSMMIDYSDHWSHFDQSINAYNFLRYREDDWKRWSPALMYQNRMRHADHLALLEAAGFEVVDVKTAGNDDAGKAALATVPLADEFGERDPDDLAITTSHVTLRRTAD